MTVKDGERTYELSAKTDLWTGDADRKQGRLITTGLLGSIRWWSEVLVRGLNGNACDPTRTQCEGRNHCVVCELFGCTGWARKFRFEVLDENGNVIREQIKRNRKFRLRFIPLRPIHAEEWALLDATLHVIAGYGAIGGKTVFRPSDESGRGNKLPHEDFGLIEVVSSPPSAKTLHDDLKKYLSQWQKIDHGEFAWASLQYFWCVNGRYLGRENSNESTFNRELGRQEAKKQGQSLADHNDKTNQWLAGSQRVSKKVFSFKDPARTFGFVNPGRIEHNNKMKELLRCVGRQGDGQILTGDTILEELFPKGVKQA